MDRNEGPQKTSAASVITIVFLILPLLYILSLGPVVYVLQLTNGAGADFAEAFYYPVIWLHDNTPLKEPLEWYVDFWE